MEWNSPQKPPDPPAYLVERISDLKLAAEVSKKSPSTARNIIRKVMGQLKQHNNTGSYYSTLERADQVIIDSPMRAKALINMSIDIMTSEKQAFDIDKANPWKRTMK